MEVLVFCFVMLHYSYTEAYAMIDAALHCMPKLDCLKLKLDKFNLIQYLTVIYIY